MNKGADIVADILPLTAFFVEGHTRRSGCQGVEDSLDVFFGTTCNAHEQIGMIGQNQILYEVQNLFAGRWGPSGARTFVQSVQDNENRNLTREFEHSFETSCKGGLARLFGAITTRVVQLMKRIPAVGRGFTELEEKGLQHAVDVVFGGIFEIKIIVGDQRRPRLARGVDILNNGRACGPYEFPIHKTDEERHTIRRFSLRPLRNRERNYKQP